MSPACQNFCLNQENSAAIWNFCESDFLKVSLIVKNLQMRPKQQFLMQNAENGSVQNSAQMKLALSEQSQK